MNDASSNPLEPSVAVARPPQQGRSLASFERMMDAAEALLVQHGNDGFALTDVSRVGKVSIGSIYNRFSSKDELIQAVHARVMDRIESEQFRIVMRARSRSATPRALVVGLIAELGEFLSSFAAILRPMMLRAAFDIVVQNRGRTAHDAMAGMVSGEMLAHREAIVHPHPERAVAAVVRIAYAAFARELGFGMAEAPQGGAPWDELKSDLGEMSASFLFGALDAGPTG